MRCRMRGLLGALVTGALWGAPAPSLAHPHDAAGLDSAFAAMRARPESSLGLPSPAASQAVGLACTLAPMGVLLLAPSPPAVAIASAGVVAGPALGLAHGGAGERGGRGAAARAVLLGAGFAGFARSFDGETDAWVLLAAGGASAALLSAAWDLAWTPAHVRASNDRALRARLHGWRLAPAHGGLALCVTLAPRR